MSGPPKMNVARDAEIVALWANGNGPSLRVIGAQYGICGERVYQIIHRQTGRRATLSKRRDLARSEIKRKAGTDPLGRALFRWAVAHDCNLGMPLPIFRERAALYGVPI